MSNSTEKPKSCQTPRREVWWLDLGAKNQSLESIKRRFEDCLDRFLLSSSNSLLRHITSPVNSKPRHNLHQCPGYLREEITLASDVSKSVIISHAFPSQSEVCSICGQLVQYKCTEPPIVDGEKWEANSPNGSKSLPAMLGTQFSFDFSITVSHLYMEPLAASQSDVWEMVTPSLLGDFSPWSLVTGPDRSDPLLPMFPEWNDVQEPFEPTSFLELDPSALFVVSPTPLLDSHHLSRFQPSGIPSPHPPDLMNPYLSTFQDLTMDPFSFNYLDDIQMLPDPPLSPMFPEWEDVQEPVAEPKSLLELDLPPLNVMTPTSPLLDSHHLPRLQPSGIPSPHSQVVIPRRGYYQVPYGFPHHVIPIDDLYSPVTQQ